MGTIIKNVAFLNLTQTSEESLKEIKEIKNVAFMVYDQKFEPFMSKISFSDIASSAKVTGKFSTINGKFELDQNFAAGSKEPLFLIVNGKVIVKPDVTADMIDKTISGLIVNGKIYCPESVQAALQQKVEQNSGKMVAYMDNALLETGKLTIDNDYLRQLEPQTKVAVTEKATMVEDIDPSLFDEKVNQIQFLKEAVVLEAYQDMLRHKLVSKTGTIMTVPKDYVYVGGDLQLDASDITRYNQAKLFAAGTVYFDKDVSVDDVKNHIADIKTEGIIYCRSELKAEILKKCDPSVKVIAYSGNLRIVNGEHKLTQSELDYTEGKLTFVVDGVLDVDKKVDPKTLFEKLERLDLDGVAMGNTEQCGILQTKVGIKNGIISDNDEENEEQEIDRVEGDDTFISNVAHLKL